MDRQCSWYVQPLDSVTNAAFARELPEENAQRGMADDGGGQHDVWECSYQGLAVFVRSKESLGLRFKIFAREGKSAPLRDKTKLMFDQFFGKAKKANRATVVTAAQVQK